MATNSFFKQQLLLMLVGLFYAGQIHAYDFKAVNSDGVVIYYTIKGEDAIVTSGDEEYAGEVKIPSKVVYGEAVYNVTAIGKSAFEYCQTLKSIEIPSSVTAIGNQAFYQCTSLTSVDIPSSVVAIEDAAFEYCRSLSSVQFTEGLISIGSNAFSVCDRLQEISIPASVEQIGSGAFSRNNQMTEIHVEAGNSVYDSRGNCNAIIETLTNTLITGCQTTKIPDGIVTIGKSAFEYCQTLKSIEIPSSVTAIGNQAFYQCTSLTSVDIPSSVVAIEDAAFEYCRSLSSVQFTEGLISIGSNAFSVCDRLQEISIPASVEQIGSGAFSRNNQMTEIHVEAGNSVYDSRGNCNAIIETLTNTLITGCQTTKIPDGIVTIGKSAFEYCQTLKSIEIPSSVTAIGNQAFYQCTSLTSVDIPSSVVAIEDAAFEYCRSLSSVQFTEGLISIGSNAFSVCDRLQEISIPASVEQIGSGAFSRNNQMTEIHVEAGNSVYDSRGNCNAIIETLTNTLITGCQTTKIPDGIVTIGKSAFEYCQTLKSIEIPSSVTAIGNQAFYQCANLESVLSNIQNPFKVNSNVFDYISNDAILYVPAGTKEAYLSVGGWDLHFAEIREMAGAEEIFLADGIITYCSPYALDFTEVEGMTAYIASGFSPLEQEVVMTRVEKVPAQTGLLLIGEAGKSYEVPFTETDYVYSNLLVGVTENKEIVDGYILNGDLFESVNAGQTIKAGSAYLDIAAKNGRALKIRFADDEDGIDEVHTITAAQDIWHTLSGTRLNGRPSQEGVYLNKGRKVLVR